MPTQGLVESVAVVLTPRCLSLPVQYRGPARGYRLLRFPAAPGRPSLQFSSLLHPDGVARTIEIPRQMVSSKPFRFLTSTQTIPLTHDLIASPRGQSPSRRTWFLCPQPGCFARCSRLYLPDHATQLACRRCHHLEYRSHARRHWRRAKAIRAGLFATPPTFTLSRHSPVALPLFRLCCAPEFLRWELEGRGRKHYWLGGADRNSK